MTEQHEVEPNDASDVVIARLEQHGGDSSMAVEPPAAPLDLSRPELAKTMRRYTSDDVCTPNTRSIERDVLLVAFPEEKRQKLAAAFAQAEWRTHFCEGPPAVACPLVTAGRACELRTTVDVAVVAIDPDHRLSSGQVPIAFCAGCGASPGVIVVQRDMDEVEIEGPTALVGGTSKPEVVVGAAEALIENDLTAADPTGISSFSRRT
jgi:hypothetical protein